MNVSMIISKVNYDAIDADNTSCQSYYIIRFSSYPYRIQEDLNINEQVVYCGEIVCERTYLFSITISSRYYIYLKIKQNHCTSESNYQWQP